MKIYDRNRMTAITTDYSKIGIGFFMQQKYCSCVIKDPRCGPGHCKLVTPGSRFCKAAETRYSPVEGEALSMAYALNSAQMYTMGNVNLLVAVDHGPLLQIMGPRPLEEIMNPSSQVLVRHDTHPWEEEQCRGRGQQTPRGRWTGFRLGRG